MDRRDFLRKATVLSVGMLAATRGVKAWAKGLPSDPGGTVGGSSGLEVIALLEIYFGDNAGNFEGQVRFGCLEVAHKSQLLPVIARGPPKMPINQATSHYEQDHEYNHESFHYQVSRLSLSFTDAVSPKKV